MRGHAEPEIYFELWLEDTTLPCLLPSPRSGRGALIKSHAMFGYFCTC